MLKKSVRYIFTILSALIFSSIVSAIPLIDFVDPTPSNNAETLSTSFIVNVSITESNLKQIKYDWNGTNFTLFSTNLVLFTELNNNSALNENSTGFKDSSPNQYAGLCFNCPTLVTGKYGNAYDFDGINDALNFSSSITGADLTNKTIMAWIYPKKSQQQAIVDKDFDHGAPSYGGWGLWFQSNNKLWWWNHANKDILDTGSMTAANNAWSHVAVVWDSNAKMAYFYINGKLNSNKSDSTIVEKASNAVILSIGSFRNNSGSYFNGTIDEVQVWNISMTQTQIYQQYASNVHKYNSTQWYVYVNQSKNASDILGYAAYTYSASAQNSSGSENATNTRTINIVSSLSTSSVPEFEEYALLFILSISLSGFFYIKHKNQF